MLEGDRVNTLEDAAESIGAGNATGQLQELRKLGLLAVAVVFDVFPAFGPGNDGEDGNRQDVREVVGTGALDAGVGNITEEALQVKC